MDVKTLCLGVLSLGEASGYQIRKVFEQAFSHFFVAGFGSIYPALAELAATGLVTCTAVADGRGPAKKVYTLTASGEQALRTQLAAAAPDHKVRSQFLVLMAFAHLLPPERLAAVLAERLEALERELAQIRAALDDPAAHWQPGARFAAGYGLAVLEAARNYVRDHQDELAGEGTP